MKFIPVFLFFVFTLVFCQPKMIAVVDEFHDNGRPQKILYYKDFDQKELLKEELYYENGRLKLSGTFKNKLKHGRWVYYYENGFISDEAWFYKGLLHGRSSSSYKNGWLRSNGYYRNGERVREWTYFDENGKLLKRIQYNNKNLINHTLEKEIENLLPDF